MEPTEVMMLGKLGAGPKRRVGAVTTAAFGRDPQWRTTFMNPPPTTPQFPQNLMRQTVMNGLGGGEVVNLRGTDGKMTTGGIIWGIAGSVATGALVYHGYKRSRKHPIGSALLWFLGSIVWPITLPIAFAQGYAKKKRR